MKWNKFSLRKLIRKKKHTSELMKFGITLCQIVRQKY